MAWTQLFTLAGKAAPALAKQLPKPWPLLLESKNRQKLMEVAGDLASQSPRKRLEGRIELTAALADGLAEKTTNDEERALAEDWARRARNLKIRLEMPVHDRRVRKEHRASIQAQLHKLQVEMNAHLGDQPAIASDSNPDGNGTERDETHQLPNEAS